MYILPNSYNFNNISFTQNKTPVYAIDSEGNYRRFNSKAQAAKEIGTSLADIHRSCKNQSHTTKGYYIVDADEVETKCDNGEIAVYKSKIDEILEYRKNTKAIYVVDKQGNYRKFQNQARAAEELGISDGNISRVILGKLDTCKGYIIIRASEIEHKDKEGKTVIDEKKIKEILKSRLFKKAIYAVDKQGNYRKFQNQARAAEELGESRQSVNQAVKGRSKTCGGYFLVQANEVESKDEDGRVLIDEAKMNELIVKRMLNIKS